MGFQLDSKQTCTQNLYTFKIFFPVFLKDAGYCCSVSITPSGPRVFFRGIVLLLFPSRKCKAGMRPNVNIPAQHLCSVCTGKSPGMCITFNILSLYDYCKASKKDAWQKTSVLLEHFSARLTNLLDG